MANNQQIDETQLQSILSEVEAELGKLAKSDLAKARPGENTESEDTSDASTTDPSGDNTSAASESPDAASASPDAAGGDGPPPADAGSAPPGGDPAADPSAAGGDPSADPSAGGDPAADQGPIDPQALMAEYAKLAPEDQKLHYMCLKQVLMQTLAGAGADPGSAPGADAGAGAPPPGAGAGAGAPPPGASPAGPPPDASAGAPPPPTLKAESGMSNDPKANGDLSKVTGGASLSKSEFDAAVNAQVEAAIAPLFKAVKHVLEAPLRKSVKSVADLGTAPAPEVDVSKMSREQIRSKLSEKLKAGTLSKSEKDLMIGFDTGKVKAIQIPAHLLK